MLYKIFQFFFEVWHCFTALNFKTKSSLNSRWSDLMLSEDYELWRFVIVYNCRPTNAESYLQNHIQELVPLQKDSCGNWPVRDDCNFACEAKGEECSISKFCSCCNCSTSSRIGNGGSRHHFRSAAAHLSQSSIEQGVWFYVKSSMLKIYYPINSTTFYPLFESFYHFLPTLDVGGSCRFRMVAIPPQINFDWFFIEWKFIGNITIVR